jgi:hypothetical protein
MFRVGTTVAARVWSKYVELFCGNSPTRIRSHPLRACLAAPIAGRVRVSASARARSL